LGEFIVYDSEISSHLRPILQDGGVAYVGSQLIEYARELDVEFDAIAVCGYSGAIAGSILAYAMNKNLVIVRKESEDCHSPLTREGVMCGDYIIVDDLVNSGSTIEKIVNEVDDLCEYAECRGVLLWNNFDDKPRELSLDKTPGFCFKSLDEIRNMYI
jgi:adenine/guanine phosphoribosyltransferase-like PRPP-binding protein